MKRVELRTAFSDMNLWFSDRVWDQLYSRLDGSDRPILAGQMRNYVYFGTGSRWGVLR